MMNFFMRETTSEENTLPKKELVLTIFLDGGRIKGSLDVSNKTTLADVRNQIDDEFDDDMIPLDFAFYLMNDVRICIKQEKKILAWDYLDKNTKELSIKSKRIKRSVVEESPPSKRLKLSNGATSDNGELITPSTDDHDSKTVKQQEPSSESTIIQSPKSLEQAVPENKETAKKSPDPNTITIAMEDPSNNKQSECEKPSSHPSDVLSTIHSIEPSVLEKETAKISDEEFQKLLTHWSDLDKQIQNEVARRKALVEAEIARKKALEEAEKARKWAETLRKIHEEKEKLKKERKALMESHKCFGCKNVFKEGLKECSCFDEDYPSSGFKLCDDCVEKEEYTGTEDPLVCSECSKNICRCCEYRTCGDTDCEEIICEKCNEEESGDWKYCTGECDVFCGSCQKNKKCPVCHELFCEKCQDQTQCDNCQEGVCKDCSFPEAPCGCGINLCHTCFETYECDTGCCYRGGW